MLTSLLFFVGAATLVYAVCPQGCDQPVAIYEDLQCKPIYAKPTDCCPSKFDCSNIAKRPDNKCTYRGKAYDFNQELPHDVTYPDCRIGCRCVVTDLINCGALDCPEWLGARPNPGNHFTYTLDECCATGQKAAPYATCKVGDHEYKEGERFPGPKRCTQCICAKGWDGKFAAPFCTKKTCAEEMKSLWHIKRNCAPSYLIYNNPCCPFTWICPDDAKAEDKITINPTPSSSNKEQCKYGPKNFNIGDKLERIQHVTSTQHYEIKCECLIPPFLTCNQKQVFT